MDPPSHSMPFQKVMLRRRETDIDMEARSLEMPLSWVEPLAVSYRSTGIGLFGVLMRFVGMPLEKIALFMNSSQVTGKKQFQQAVRLTFQEGIFAPYRVVGPASLTAWFLQYSVMGCAFQFFDHGLSKLLGVRPVYYGSELMQPPPSDETETREQFHYQVKSGFKMLLAPMLSAGFESQVSNRAEVQRYFGPKQFQRVTSRLNWNPIRRTGLSS